MDAKGLLIGGLIPALMFGVAGFLQKATMRTGAGLGPYLLCIGLGVVTLGGVMTLAGGGAARTISPKATLMAGSIGLAWGLGMWLVAIGISRYGAPLAKVAPLYNMNTLVVVVLALIFFAEYRDVVVAKLILGASLIMVGGYLVANS